MPRQTRQQRRERRATQGDPAQQRAAAQRLQPVSTPAAESAPAQSGGFGPIRFVRESASELKKVEWPGQPQLIQGTIVVLVACIIVGFFLWGNDQIWQRVVHKLLIK